jgi:hypothetical protein
MAKEQTKREAGEDQSGNPWHPSYPEKDRAASIERFIRAFGSAASARMARAAGVDYITGQPIRKD